MINLPQVTMICVDCNRQGQAIFALQKSLKHITPFATKLITDIDIQLDNEEKIEVVKIDKPIRSKEAYSEFIVKKLNDYFETEYVLVIQHDGYVLDGNAWTNEFLKYDYIGASWLYTDGRNVGNGGFSLRTKRLQEILQEDDFIEMLHPEDEIIGRLYRKYLEEKYLINFATEDIADKFSFELKQPLQSTFGFHSYFHKPYQKIVIIRRWAAMGDVIMVEPVLKYFYNKGYRVVLDTFPNYKMLFYKHYFPIEFIDEIDGRLIETAEYYNLDMSYEIKPKQLHLKSYFEFCGITDYVLENPKLSLGIEINQSVKPFKKYVVIHNDIRPQPYRNVYNIDWQQAVELLNKYGYTVIQVGKGEHIPIKGAIEMNLLHENQLAWITSCADLFIGIDSGVSNIASAFDVPSIIFFGSVNPYNIHPQQKNKIYIHNHDNKVCDKPFCWDEVIGTEGIKCYVNEKFPPCTQYQTQQLIDEINKIINNE
jgi:ADP-heptose:LPS heptosyltransferase